MKSVTWLVFSIIFIFSAIYVFKHEKYSWPVEIVKGYPLNFSVNRGQDLEFYLNAQVDHKKGVVYIYDINHDIVDSLILNLIKQANSMDTMMYKNGYRYVNKYTYNTYKLKSGIYFLGNIVPFLVKEPQLKNSITVVFPYANFMVYSNEGGKSFGANNSSHGIAAQSLSLERLPAYTNNPFAFIAWITKNYGHKNLNFISDLDLENGENVAHTNLLILFGYQAFWTIKERQNLDHYLDHGGKLFAMCASLINYKMTYHKDKNQLTYIVPTGIHDSLLNEKNAAIWNSFYANTKSIGCSSELSCPPEKLRENRGAYTIINKKHLIFKGIEVDSIVIDTQNGNAIDILDCNFKDIPEPNRSINGFILNEILAYDFDHLENRQKVTGIFNFKKTIQSGEIIVIGNEKWCFPDNIESAIISKITSNCIDYLSSDSTSHPKQ
jgi:hypothetical protein